MAFAVINSVSAAPDVVSVVPNGTVSDDSEFTVTFNETINITENSTIELRNNNTGENVPIHYSNSSNVLTITPLAKLLAGVKYTIFLNNLTDVAGNEMGLYTSTFTVAPMKAYWMWASDVADANAADLRYNKGITDLFVLTRGVTGKTYLNELAAAVAKFHSVGINVHAWIVCFKDSSGNFVDPSGYYTKSVYVKTIKYWGWKKKAYKVKKKVRWKKVNGKWKYKYRIVIKYKWRKGWIYKAVYKTVSGYDGTFNNNLINFIRIVATYNVDGIHLDYVRYSGVASKGHAAWQEPGGQAAAVNAVTNFVSVVRSNIKSVNPDILLSAALMPETYNNANFYGQDYGRLSSYLDFFVPMTYEGNYNAGDSWITNTVAYIVARANGKPVYSGLTTYYSDSNTRTLTNEELHNNAQAASDGGADGIVLFRYGIGSYVPNWLV